MTKNPFIIPLFQLFQSFEIPHTLQNLGLAFLTILIPFAIAIITKILQPEEKFQKLDFRVITEKVIKLKRLLAATALIFLPSCFWSISPVYLKFFLVLISCVGICFVIETIWRIYKWVKGDRIKYRIDYLKSLKNSKDMKIVWGEIWQSPKIDINEEEQYLKIFLSKIEERLKSPKNVFRKSLDQDYLIIIYELLFLFRNHLKNRNLYSCFNNDMLPKFLKWHFLIWVKVYKLTNKVDKVEEWSNYDNYDSILRVLDSMIKIIQKRVLKEEFSLFYVSLDQLHQHLNKHQKYTVGNNYYVKYFLTDLFYPVFFENITHFPEDYSHDIWKHFPKEWKITKGKLENEENIILNTTLIEFLRWAHGRIWKQEKGFDDKLYDVSENLFPEVNPTLWAQILIFYFYFLRNNRDLVNVIEHLWNFDFPVEKEGGGIENTFELVYAVSHSSKISSHLSKMFLHDFSEVFSKENLEKYIIDLEKLQFSEKSQEERKQQVLLKIFKQMSEFLDSKK